MSNKHLKELIEKYQQDKLDDSSRQLMDDWADSLEGQADNQWSATDITGLKAKLMGKTVHKPKTRHRSFTIKIAIAATILMLLAVGISLFIKSPVTNTPSYSEVSKGKEYQGKQFISLPDGTTVLLNDNSQLSYSDNFGEGMREIMLVGEAFFNVAKNTNAPFIVNAGELKTTVLGTSFNIKAYQKENVQVTVETGKVKVEKIIPSKSLKNHNSSPLEIEGSKMPKYLTAKQQAIYNATTGQIKTEVLQGDTQSAVAWKANFLILNDMTMAEAIKEIAQHFEMKVTLSNNDLKNCRINTTFLEGESLDYVLKIITGIWQAEYKIDGDQVVIEGGLGCKEVKN